MKAGGEAGPGGPSLNTAMADPGVGTDGGGGGGGGGGTLVLAAMWLTLGLICAAGGWGGGWGLVRTWLGLCWPAFWFCSLVMVLYLYMVGAREWWGTA